MQMPELQGDTDQNNATSNTDHATAHQVINNTSLNNLSVHAWKIVGIRGAKDFHFKSDDSVFLFSKDLKFKAFLACNSIYGKYEADGAGKFLLRDLNSSNKSCNDSRDQEVLIESMLLAVDGYFIDNQTLYLGAKGKPVLAFTETSKTVKAVESQRSSKGKSGNKTKGKSKRSKTSAKNVSSTKSKNKAQSSVKNKVQGAVKVKSQDRAKAKNKK
jgi:heat shock protein HslJ